jgi:hypothetical protein
MIRNRNERERVRVYMCVCEKIETNQSKMLQTLTCTFPCVPSYTLPPPPPTPHHTLYLPPPSRSPRRVVAPHSRMCKRTLVLVPALPTQVQRPPPLVLTLHGTGCSSACLASRSANSRCGARLILELLRDAVGIGRGWRMVGLCLRRDVG